MDLWYFPTQNVLLNVFIRGCVVFAGAVFGLGQSYYNAYWFAIIHDTISLSLMPRQ